MDINQMGETVEAGAYDGAFIHCGIHHLSTAELTDFAMLLGRSPQGFPTILIEPVYLDRANFFGQILAKAFSKLYSLVHRFYLNRSPPDEQVSNATDKLIKLANDKGWFLSPKEVPFEIRELRRLFSKHFDVKEVVPVTYFGLAAAQHLATLKDQDRASEMGSKLLPVLNLVDRWLIKLNILPLMTSDYLFCRIVLIRQ
jgi:hypothetical protein